MVSRDEAVQKAKDDFAVGVPSLVGQVAGDAFDEGVANGGGGGPSEEEIQKRIDDAVQVARDEDAKVLADQKALDDEALAEEHQKGVDALAALQVQIEELSKKLSADDSIIQGLKNAQDQIQAVLDALKAIGVSVPESPPAA